VRIRYKLVQASPFVTDRAVKQSSDTASAETWSPSLAPGERPDPNRIHAEAKTLAAQGQYEEALQRHLWYHNHALEFGVGQGGVRLSFALSAWIELGRKYPKARQALVEIRDRKTRELTEGRGSFDLFQDVASINGYLQDEDATFALFKTVLEKDLGLAKQCFILAEDLLVKKGEYALCLSFIPDPGVKFGGIFRSWKSDQDIARINPKLNHPDFHKGAEDRFVTKTCQLIEILVGTGRKVEAEKIREQALTFLDDPRLKSAISDAEQKAVSNARRAVLNRSDATLRGANALIQAEYALARSLRNRDEITQKEFEQAGLARDQAAEELSKNQTEEAKAHIRLFQAEKKSGADAERKVNK
jgi:hypothetical protein